MTENKWILKVARGKKTLCPSLTKIRMITCFLEKPKLRSFGANRHRL